MPHLIEEEGIRLLMDHLRQTGHSAQRRHGTFDLDVDGQYAEVKSKTKCFDEFDFISLTQNQWDAAKNGSFDIYVVCGVGTSKPEFYKLLSKALLARQPRIVTSYEFDKNLIKDSMEQL